ncbi:MAG: hypothetical protein M3198_09685, partial [Actinomycetota bacterium]|nr:hypothetical protein [Actinomycetota bacterium]
TQDMVLEPAEYCVRAVTEVTNMDQNPKPQYWYGFFQSGPPPLGGAAGKTTYPGGGVLADLSSYVARTVPEDGAGEEGKRPPYRGYDAGVEFNENYVDRLYLRAKRPLGMRILDNNGRPVTEIANHWGKAPERRLSEGERKWIATLNLSNSQRCAQVNWSEVPTDGLLLAGGEGMLLQPGALHRAELVARDASKPEPDVVHSFEFTTSSFVNFAHHMHSFEERVWEVPVDASTATQLDQLFTNALNAVNPRVQSVKDKRKDLEDKAARVKGPEPMEKDFKDYDDALKAVHGARTELEAATNHWFSQVIQSLGLRPTSTVQALELSVVKSPNGRHALLLESPTPIDWRRIKLTLQRADTQKLPVASSSLSMKPASSVKISDARRSTDTDYWVELFAREETALDGFKLQVAADAPTLSFKHYYTVPQGTVLPVGKRLRIHAPGTTTREAGVGYLAQDAGKLQSGEQTPLPAGIAWIRLLDNAGQVVHQQPVQPEANYAPPLVLDLSVAGATDALLLPNLDGTRALILLKDQAGVGVPAGAYALTFEFRRDIGSEAPVLREAGRPTPELVTLRYLLKPVGTTTTTTTTTAAATTTGARSVAGPVAPLAAGDGQDRLAVTTASVMPSDTMLPDSTTIDDGPSGTDDTNSASFSFSSSEENPAFQCSLDGAAFIDCTSPKVYTGLADGEHTFRVWAIDAAGNPTSAPASRTWRVDTVAPRGTVVINGGAETTGSRIVMLTLGASDPSPGSGVSSMRFSNDRTLWSAWEPYAIGKSWTLSNGAGTKTVYVQYRDHAGNVSAVAQDSIRYIP